MKMKDAYILFQWEVTRGHMQDGDFGRDPAAASKRWLMSSPGQGWISLQQIYILGASDRNR